MRPAPENVDGQVIESHEFSHSVEHQVNWSHVLLAAVVLLVIWRLAPVASEAAKGSRRDRDSR